MPRQIMRGHTDRIRCVAHLPDGTLITCSDDGSLRLWDLGSGTQIGEDWRDKDNEGRPVLIMALSPNGKTVATGCTAGIVTLWDVETKRIVTKWKSGDADVWSVCWSVDGERVASGSRDGTVRVWEVESGKTVLGPIQTGHHNVYATIYSPDTTKIATGGQNGIKIHDAKTGKLLSTVGHEEQVWSLAWTSDQKKLISGSILGPIRIFDTATWQQIAILQGHDLGPGAVRITSLSRSDRLLASASYDKTARLWNLDTNLPVGPPLQHEELVGGAAISADGKLLVTGCRDGNAYIWDIQIILTEAGIEDLLCTPNVSAHL
jgi:WD40 repeat protein